MVPRYEMCAVVAGGDFVGGGGASLYGLSQAVSRMYVEEHFSRRSIREVTP